MKNQLLIDYELEQISEVAATLLTQFSDTKIWLFEGTLGAGKTSLIQHLGQLLDIKSDILSPSYGLVNEYFSPTRGIVYHMDLYRLKSLEEAVEIGLFEMVDSGYFCLIEWASAIDFQPAVPFLRIQIEHQHKTARQLSVQVYEN